MITLYFLRAWCKWLASAALALVIERAILGWSWLFVLVALPTLAVFALLTWLIYSDWRATRRSGIGYRYDIFRDITH